MAILPWEARLDESAKTTEQRVHLLKAMKELVLHNGPSLHVVRVFNEVARERDELKAQLAKLLEKGG